MKYEVGRHESRGLHLVTHRHPFLPMHDENGRLLYWIDSPLPAMLAPYVPPSPDSGQVSQPESPVVRGLKGIGLSVGLLAMWLAGFCLLMFAMVLVAGLIGGLR